MRTVLVMYNYTINKVYTLHTKYEDKWIIIM